MGNLTRSSPKHACSHAAEATRLQFRLTEHDHTATNSRDWPQQTLRELLHVASGCKKWAL